MQPSKSRWVSWPSPLGSCGAWRHVLTSADDQPAAASYLRVDGDTAYRAWAINVLTLPDGLVAAVTSFIGTAHFKTFGLPTELMSPPPVPKPTGLWCARCSPFGYQAFWQTVAMPTADPKVDLHRYLQVAREALLWRSTGSVSTTCAGR